MKEGQFSCNLTS